MTSQKIIRRELVTGQFTTIHHSILFDNRLSQTAFRVLTIILSNSDNFKINRNYFIKTLGVDKKTIQSAFKNLEACGYMKRTELKRGYNYTISEFGNLNSGASLQTADSGQPELVAEPKKIKEEPAIEVQLPILTVGEILNDVTAALPPVYTDNQLVDILTYLNTAIDEGRLTSKEQLTSNNLKKIIGKFIKQEMSSIDRNAVLVQIKSFVEECATHKQITISTKKIIVDKVMSWVEEQDLTTITDSQVKNKVYTVKSGYISYGHLDQKYQN
jgi:predicted transcriptional regulator